MPNNKAKKQKNNRYILYVSDNVRNISPSMEVENKQLPEHDPGVTL